jgi:HSP20 family protein
MKHDTIAKAEPMLRFPDLPDMRHWLETLPSWFAPFEAMRLEEQMLDDTFVVRAEMPGIDPDKDADIWIADGMLHIKVERTRESRDEKPGSFRSEFSYGSFHRAVAMPKGTKADDVTATYKDGVLEVRLPVKPVDDAASKVTITKM